MIAADGAALRSASAAAIASLAAIGLALSLPFLQPLHGYPLTSFYSEWLALALGLAAVVPLAAHRGWRALEIPVLTLFLAAFGALLAVQNALGLVPYAGQALVAVLYLGWAALLMVVAATLRREIGLGALVAEVAWFVLAGSVLGALAALLQHLGMADALAPFIARKPGAAVYGNLAQPNHFAVYTALGLASLVYLNASGRLGIVAAAAPTMLLTFVLGLSGSRSAWAFLAVLLALACFYAWRTGPVGRRPLAWSVVLVAAFVVAQWLAMVSSPVSVPVEALATTAPAAGPETTRVVTSAERLFGSVQTQGFRAQLVRESWWIFLQAPVAGVGWGQFPWQDFAYRALTRASVWGWPFNHAHNIGLQLLAETGLAGACLVVGAGLFWLWGLRRAELDLERWWLLAVLGVLGAHSMVELPMWYAYFLGIAAVALGAGSERNFAITTGRRTGAALLVMVAVGVLPLATTFHAYRGLERLFARDGSAPEGAERAAILSRAHGEPILKPYAELALSFGLDVSRERLREKIELNARVMRFAPIDVVLVRHAMLLALAGEREPSLRLISRVGRVYPSAMPDALRAIEKLAMTHPEMNDLLKLADSIIAELDAGRRAP